MHSSDGLGARDALIVARTVAGATPTAIAAELGVSVHTVYRRLKLPHVKLAITEARAAEVRPLVDRAVGEVQRSVDRLVAVRDAETTRDGDRIRASVALLDWFRDVWEMGEVMPRLAALEVQIASRAAHGTEFTPDDNHVMPVGREDVPAGLVEDDDAASVTTGEGGM